MRQLILEADGVDVGEAAIRDASYYMESSTVGLGVDGWVQAANTVVGKNPLFRGGFVDLSVAELHVTCLSSSDHELLEDALLAVV